MTSNELRKMFLEEGAPLVQKMLSDANNFNPDNPDAQISAQAAIWPLLANVIADAKDIQELNLQNTADVIKLLSGGKISVDDALKLMEAMQIKSDVDELPKLIGALENFN